MNKKIPKKLIAIQFFDTRYPWYKGAYREFVERINHNKPLEKKGLYELHLIYRGEKVTPGAVVLASLPIPIKLKEKKAK